MTESPRNIEPQNLNRRSFLHRLTGLIHAMIGAIVLLPGVQFLRSTAQGARSNRGFSRVAELTNLKIGVPALVSVVQDRWDAFIHYPPGPVGSVWLVAQEESKGDETPQVRCLQSICPHLGCAIDFAPDRDAFVCPCHASEFGKSGEVKFGPSPRSMDELPLRISEPDSQGRRWVEIEYQEFKTGKVDREALS